MDADIPELPLVVFEDPVHQVGYLAEKLGIPIPVRIHETLWELVCLDHPAYGRIGLSPSERISGILAAFHLAAFKVAEKKLTEHTISFSVKLPVLKKSLLFSTKGISTLNTRVEALLHQDEEGRIVCTLWSEAGRVKRGSGSEDVSL
ncbi:hypothetical protein [Marispirochaeta aestuarii]|uniref:hypothetical protein n=1 Tax=Marispirochaeta aestuarii TaxID=1963862 RepID=UPI0029C757E9|nr:hypothetical protein [Marispirochaeta aestuarii]